MSSSLVRFTRTLACLAVVAGCSGGADSDGASNGGGNAGMAGASGATAGGAAGTAGGTSGGSGGAAGSGAAGTGGGAAAGSGGVAGSTGGTGGLPTCNDPGPEPNETDPTATRLAEIDDCNGSGSSVSAVSNGTRDTDYFVFFGRDASVRCRVDPAAQIDTGGLRLCMFANCPADTTTVTCLTGTLDSSDSGYHGCCSDAGGVALDVKCGQTSLNADDADVFIRVDQVTTDDCVPYTVTYHY